MKILSKFKNMLRLHSAGSTVSHVSPFADLLTYLNDEDLTAEEINAWVAPYYMSTLSMQVTEDIVAPAKNVDSSLIRKLLGDFNWRTRSMGAVFALLKNEIEHEQQISNLLLKSEVCYAGSTYCYVLAAFSNRELCRCSY